MQVYSDDRGMQEELTEEQLQEEAAAVGVQQVTGVGGRLWQRQVG